MIILWQFRILYTIDRLKILSKVEVVGWNIYNDKLGKRIRACKDRLKILRERRDLVSLEGYREMMGRLEVLLDQEEMYWK